MFNSSDRGEGSTDPGRLEAATPMGFITPSLTLSHRDPWTTLAVSVHGGAFKHTFEAQ